MNPAPSEHVIGLSAFVAVTSPDLQIEAISIEDIAAIFAGDIRNWSDLGGPNLPITPFIREQSSNARNDFEQMVMVPSGKTISPSVIAGLSDATVAAAVAQASGAIGITNPVDIAGARPLGLLGSCGIVSRPDQFSIKTGNYPLTRALVAGQAEAPPPLGADLLDFAISDEGQAAIAGAGFFGQQIEAEDASLIQKKVNAAMRSGAEGPRRDLLASFVSTLFTAQRLTSTFRFAQGADTQNAWGRAEFSRLAAHLADPEFDRTEVLFVGFSGSNGTLEEALSESDALAQTTLRAFQDYAPEVFETSDVSFRSLGFGDVNKTACSEETSGANINRRVEVWVR